MAKKGEKKGGEAAIPTLFWVWFAVAGVLVVWDSMFVTLRPHRCFFSFIKFYLFMK